MGATRQSSLIFFNFVLFSDREVKFTKRQACRREPQRPSYRARNQRYHPPDLPCLPPLASPRFDCASCSHPDEGLVFLRDERVARLHRRHDLDERGVDLPQQTDHPGPRPAGRAQQAFESWIIAARRLVQQLKGGGGVATSELRVGWCDNTLKTPGGRPPLSAASSARDGKPFCTHGFVVEQDL